MRASVPKPHVHAQGQLVSTCGAALSDPKPHVHAQGQLVSIAGLEADEAHQVGADTMAVPDISVVLGARP